MRVLIDTNVLISAALSAGGTPYQAYVKAASYPNHGLICEQNVDELKRIFNKKFPNRLAALDKFLSAALLTLELISAGPGSSSLLSEPAKPPDRPLLPRHDIFFPPVSRHGPAFWWIALSSSVPLFF